MKLVILTQYRENYGAHDWSGEGDCPQYWKNKGGEIYVVEGVEANKAIEFPSIVERATKHFDCIYSNNYSEETLFNWEVYEDNETPWEKWERPKTIQLENL